jgi:hypothetical protein
MEDGGVMNEKGNRPPPIAPRRQGMTFEAGTPLAMVATSLIRTVDGVLLLVLSVLFLVGAVEPSLVQQLTNRYCARIDVDEMTLVFALMPVVLVAEFLWFSIGGRLGKTSVLRVFVLLVTAFIPFMRLCGGVYGF